MPLAFTQEDYLVVFCVRSEDPFAYTGEGITEATGVVGNLAGKTAG